MVVPRGGCAGSAASMHVAYDKLCTHEPSRPRGRAPRLDRPVRRLLIGTTRWRSASPGPCRSPAVAVQAGTVVDPSWLPVWPAVASLVAVAVLAHQAVLPHGAAVLLIAVLPVLVFAAALLRLCSAGPVLVRDVRHGPSGDPARRAGTATA